jgi:hypothetical protein
MVACDHISIRTLRTRQLIVNGESLFSGVVLPVDNIPSLDQGRREWAV